MALNLKQQQFVLEYLIDKNATQAALRAGYAERTAYSQGQRLLKHVEVQAQIEAAIEEQQERTKVTADKVIKEYARVAFAHMGEYASWDSSGIRWVPSQELSEDQLACVSELTETIRELDDGGTTTTRRFKLYNKLSALQDLAKHLGLFAKDKAPSSDVNVSVNVDNSQKVDFSTFSEEELENYIGLQRKLLQSAGRDNANSSGHRGEPFSSRN